MIGMAWRRQRHLFLFQNKSLKSLKQNTDNKIDAFVYWVCVWAYLEFIKLQCLRDMDQLLHLPHPSHLCVTLLNDLWVIVKVRIKQVYDLFFFWHLKTLIEMKNPPKCPCLGKVCHSAFACRIIHCHCGAQSIGNPSNNGWRQISTGMWVKVYGFSRQKGGWRVGAYTFDTEAKDFEAVCSSFVPSFVLLRMFWNNKQQLSISGPTASAGHIFSIWMQTRSKDWGKASLCVCLRVKR